MLFNVILKRWDSYITEIPDNIKDVLELNDYAVQTRYPGDYSPIEEQEYKRAVKIAESVLFWVLGIINTRI